MQSANQPVVSHSILSSGVDWITATAQSGEARISMMEYTRHERARLMEAGETIKSGYRLGYYGWGVEGFFHGQREGSSIIIASGQVADRVWRPVSNVSDNVSRLDLQVTLATPTDRPHLGVQGYCALRSGTPRKIGVTNASLITSQPEGETLSINKRSSDSFGRVYDKATEARLGAPCSMWRYEVEFKRTRAARVAARLTRADSHQAAAARLVHEWFDARGVAPIYSPDDFSCPHELILTPNNRDVLSWFEQSLSVTVARAVKRYGLERVLEALNLLKPIEANYERRKTDA